MPEPMKPKGSGGDETSTFKMAEQAQRRAPEAQPQQNSSNDSHALEELRHLIVAPEQEGLAEIRDRIDNLERRAEDVSSVVAEAIQMRREQGDDQALAAALAPTIEATLHDSVRDHPHVIADALFPVMGPAIRKSIAETLRTMLESFNEALEHSLSWRGIQWRIEAIRTGTPFAQIVMMHSLVYRVEEVFLIHRKTGLVLSHVAAPDVTQIDPDMLAGLLSAIEQFAQEAFRAERSESLDSFQVGEKPTWVEAGPNAILAAAFRGNVPSEFRLRMRRVLEEIHARYGAALERFEGDAAPFRATEELLMPLLEKGVREEQRSAKKKKPRAVLALAAAVLIAAVAWGGYVTYRVRQWSRFEQALRLEPGIAITSFEKQGRTYRIRGFRDPLAADPAALLKQAGLDARQADFQLAPFYSADDRTVAHRARVFLKPPSSVKLTMQDGVLHAEGVASPHWIGTLKEHGPWLAGVRDLDVSHLENSEVLALNQSKKALEGVTLLFPLGRADLEAGQESKLAKAKDDIAGLLAHAARAEDQVQVEVVGHTDTTGVEASNLPLSRQRAEQVLRLLERVGVKSSAFKPIGVGTTQPLQAEDTQEGRRLNRSVTFRVSVTPVSPPSSDLQPPS